MAEVFNRVEKILNREFKKNRKMYLATSVDQRPLVKIVNMVYDMKSFYLVLSATSELALRFKANPKVSLCSTASFHKFQGEIENLGHPLLLDNQSIRTLLVEHMGNWYLEGFDEDDANLCLFKVNIESGFTYAGKTGFRIDFVQNECQRVNL